MYDYQQMHKIRKGPESFKDLSDVYDLLIDFCKKHKKIYLYGDGEIEQIYVCLLRKKGIVPKKIIKCKEKDRFLGKKIDFFDNDTGVILSIEQDRHYFHENIPSNVDLFYTSDEYLNLLYDKEILTDKFINIEKEMIGDSAIDKWEHISRAFEFLHDDELERNNFFIKKLNYIGPLYDRISTIDIKDCGIVMQGPVAKEHEFTLKTCQWYRKIYPNVPIVVSTWKQEIDKYEEYEKNNIDIIENEIPLGKDFYNTNKQVFSTKMGLEYLKKYNVKYALKTRTDQRINTPDFLLYFKNLIKLYPPNDTLNERLIFLGGSNLWNPYYITDYLAYSSIKELDKFYFLRDYNCCEKADFSASAEHFLIRTYIRKYINALSRKEGLDDDVEKYFCFLRDYVIIADEIALKLQWPKYVARKYDIHQSPLDYIKWLNLCYMNNTTIEVEKKKKMIKVINKE